MTSSNLVLVTTLLMGMFTGISNASMLGSLYIDANNSQHTIAGDTIAYINSHTPLGTFTSTVDAGTGYGSYENQMVNAWLGVDAATLTPSTHGTDAVAAIIIDLKGNLIVPAAANYTFATYSDDASVLYIDGNGTTGSGTVIVNNDGIHGGALVQNSALLGPGLHSIELIYFNSGYATGTGGATISASVKLADARVLLTAAPEPSSIILLGLGVLGLFIVDRRRRKA